MRKNESVYAPRLRELGFVEVDEVTNAMMADLTERHFEQLRTSERLEMLTSEARAQYDAAMKQPSFLLLDEGCVKAVANDETGVCWTAEHSVPKEIMVAMGFKDLAQHLGSAAELDPLPPRVCH